MQLSQSALYSQDLQDQRHANTPAIQFLKLKEEGNKLQRASNIGQIVTNNNLAGIGENLGNVAVATQANTSELARGRIGIDQNTDAVKDGNKELARSANAHEEIAAAEVSQARSAERMVGAVDRSARAQEKGAELLNQTNETLSQGFSALMNAALSSNQVMTVISGELSGMASSIKDQGDLAFRALERDALQEKIEEALFQLEDFNEQIDEAENLDPIESYFAASQMRLEIESSGIATPLIRGIDLKKRFTGNAST